MSNLTELFDLNYRYVSLESLVFKLMLDRGGNFGHYIFRSLTRSCRFYLTMNEESSVAQNYDEVLTEKHSKMFHYPYRFHHVLMLSYRIKILCRFSNHTVTFL